ncbi:hypothetical protein ACOMHN_046213 [Nucella lapillus]
MLYRGGVPCRDQQGQRMTTTSAIEEHEGMSGATTCCEEVIAAPQTAASDTDTETKATKETKDGNKGKKTEADENRVHTMLMRKEFAQHPSHSIEQQAYTQCCLGDSPPTCEVVTA